MNSNEVENLQAELAAMTGRWKGTADERDAFSHALGEVRRELAAVRELHKPEKRYQPHPDFPGSSSSACPTGEHPAPCACLGSEGESQVSEPAIPSYHDLHITTTAIPRTSIFDLPYGYEIRCSRVTGWILGFEGDLVAGEYGEKGLTLDVNGVVIVSSRDMTEEELADA